MRNNKGFTLIELIMVTIILGIMAAVAIPRYMGTVNKAEEAAEQAVIDALNNAIEAYANEQFIDHGRYRYPSNPFDLVDVDGYQRGLTSMQEEDLEDGWYEFTVEEEGDNGYGFGYILHKRRDNMVYGWDYSWEDLSDGDSDDRGHLIGAGGMNREAWTDQDELSNNN